MSSSTVDFLIHGPPESPPADLARAFLDAVNQTNIDKRSWRLLDYGDHPGVDSMTALIERSADPNVISTFTPVFIQAPLLGTIDHTHHDLTPLARLVTDQYLIVVHTTSPITDVETFLSELTKRPTRTGGYFKGGINHLLGLAIAEATDSEINFVVLKNESDTWTALIDGRIDWACGVPSQILPYIKDGSYRALAVLADRRALPFPEIPTLSEAGATVTFNLWRGLIGPPDLDAITKRQWCTIAEVAICSAQWQDYLEQNGQTDGFLVGDDFTAFLDSEWDWYEKHLGVAGLLPTVK